MAKAKVRSPMDRLGKLWRTEEPSSSLDASGKGLGACSTEWDFVASEWWMEEGGELSRALFHTLRGGMLLKRCVLVVVFARYRGGGAGAEPGFFYIEKHHGIGDDSGGILLVAEIDLALDALDGGSVKVETFWKRIVSQWAVL
jgi:hypothetical protein